MVTNINKSDYKTTQQICLMVQHN